MQWKMADLSSILMRNPWLDGQQEICTTRMWSIPQVIASFVLRWQITHLITNCIIVMAGATGQVLGCWSLLLWKLNRDNIVKSKKNLMICFTINTASVQLAVNDCNSSRLDCVASLAILCHKPSCNTTQGSLQDTPHPGVVMEVHRRLLTVNP